MYKKIIVFAATFLAVASSNAETLWCEGQITNSYVSAGSELYIHPDWGEWKKLCNLDGDYNGISTATCNAWLSMVQVSIAANKPIIIKLDDVTGDCSTQADNGLFPKPTYIRLKK